MPKGSTGGGGAQIFTSNVTGPPPGPLTVGTTAWVELLTIPNGQKIWCGSLLATSPDKSITFEVRTNIVGQSAGSDGATTVLGSVSATIRSGTKLLDLYKNGRLHITSVIGTGVEKMWIKLKSKGSDGSFLYSFNYTVE